jgi:hypothetical protein
MRILLPRAATVLLLGFLIAGSVQGQEKDGMHRLEILNGARRTVHYFGTDAPAARERGRKENDAAIADMIHDLRTLYLRNEHAMEIKRHQMQMLLYGYSTTFGTSWYPTGSFYPGYGYWGWGWGPYGGYASGLGTSTYGLQFGIGDEGALKGVLIQGLVAPTEKKP